MEYLLRHQSEKKNEEGEKITKFFILEPKKKEHKKFQFQLSEVNYMENLRVRWGHLNLELGKIYAAENAENLLKT